VLLLLTGNDLFSGRMTRPITKQLIAVGMMRCDDRSRRIA
jgi:hypothetical protein